MSTFEVTFEKVGSLSPIEGADRIERATLDGMDYSFVVKKGEFKVGDYGIYFPVDSIFPPELLEKIGMTGKLSGGQKNRVKTVKLRGAPSQGLFIPILSLFETIPFALDPTAPSPFLLHDKLAEHFGVTKYDHEAAGGNMDARGNLPEFLSKYDIESAQKYTRTLNSFDLVMVTEKAEGQNLAAGKKKDDSNFVCSRSFELKSEEETTGGANNWHKNATNNSLYEKAAAIKAKLGCDNLTIYGESCGPGIQGDYYQLGALKFFCFDIKADNKFVPPQVWLDLCKEFDVPTVPVLFIGKLSDYLGDKTVKEMSHGKSQINPTKLREGIVIKNMNPDESMERILKLRDPIYLGETGNE